MICIPNHPYGSQDTPWFSTEVDGAFLMTLQLHGRFRDLGLRAWALSSRRNVHSLYQQFRFQPLCLCLTSGSGSNPRWTNPDASRIVPCSTSQQRFLVQHWCCLLWVLHEHGGRVDGFWLAQRQQGPAPSPHSWSWICRFQDWRVVFCGPPSGLRKPRKGRTVPLVRSLLRTFPRPVYRVLWPVQNICSASNRSIEASTTHECFVIELVVWRCFPYMPQKCSYFCRIACIVYILLQKNWSAMYHDWLWSVLASSAKSLHNKLSPFG